MCLAHDQDTYGENILYNETISSLLGSDEVQKIKSKNKYAFEVSTLIKRNVDSDPFSTLKLIQIIHRHGDRSPEHSYPNDPYKNIWLQGFGQLSKLGMMQGYELGKFLRKNYTGFLSPEFHPNQIYIRSTDYDRTIMTAECVGAGLFPRSLKDNSTLFGALFNDWQPIPIHSVPQEEDNLLRPTHSCQFIKDFRAERVVKSASKRQIISNQERMLHLSKMTGMDINITSLHVLADVIFCQRQNNITGPDWMTKEIEDELMAYKLEKELVTPEDAKYLMGTLFYALMNNMNNKVMNPSDPVKLNLFSAHESTVRFLKALVGVDDHKEVPYIGAIILELHKLNNEHFVKFLYRNSTEHLPEALIVNHCSGLVLCPLSVFQKAYQDLMLSGEDWNNICQNDSSRTFRLQDNIVPILVAVLVVFLALIMFLVYQAYTLTHQVKQKLSQDQYTLLENNADCSSSENEFELEDLSGLHIEEVDNVDARATNKPK
ncbi:Testicular acid phosphatase [Bulinus truncatus]|nr:Testicular acid phosphatase [Bulinus truncatus]